MNLKPLRKKKNAKFKLSYRWPHLWNKFIAQNNDPSRNNKHIQNTINKDDLFIY